MTDGQATTLEGRLAEQRGFGETSRPDAWWLQPLVVFAIKERVVDRHYDPVRKVLRVLTGKR